MWIFNGLTSNIIKSTKFFEVRIKTEKKYYLPSEQVNGIVTLEVKQPCILKNFKLKVFAEEKVVFFEENGSNARSRRIDQEHIWINKDITCFIDENLENIKHEVGITDFHFSFQLDYDIPSSFCHSWVNMGGQTNRGEIRYSLIAELELPEQKKHYVHDQTFEVTKLPTQDIIERHDQYKKFDCINTSPLQGNLNFRKNKTFIIKESILRCFKVTGQLFCIFNYGKEIYLNNDYCNCFVDIDNSESTLDVIGIEAVLKRQGKIQIEGKFNKISQKLNSKKKDIFVSSGDKGVASIGIEIIGDEKKLKCFKGIFFESDVFLEIRIQQEGCCRHDVPTFSHKLFIIGKENFVFKKFKSLLE